NASGGFPPYKYAINGGAYQTSNSFANLSPGSYTVSAKSNGIGCSKDTVINLSLTCATAGFTTPDTVCVNTPVNIANTSTGASSYYWNFCVADVNTTPTAVNLGNPGGFLSQPVFVDLVEDNGNY